MAYNRYVLWAVLIQIGVTIKIIKFDEATNVPTQERSSSQHSCNSINRRKSKCSHNFKWVNRNVQHANSSKLYSSIDKTNISALKHVENHHVRNIKSFRQNCALQSFCEMYYHINLSSSYNNQYIYTVQYSRVNKLPP